jgi:hypothetical protein
MSDNSPEQTSEIEQLSEQEVIYRLAALGANSCNSSYDTKQKFISDRFSKLSLGIIVNMWDFLDERVKIRVLNSNSEKFKAWVIASSEQE